MCAPFRALANAASNGNDAQIASMVEQGVLQALCSSIGCSDAKINLVALDGVEKVLYSGYKLVPVHGVNPYLDIVEECGGVSVIEQVLEHDNEEVRCRSAARRAKPMPTNTHTRVICADLQARRAYHCRLLRGRGV